MYLNVDTEVQLRNYYADILTKYYTFNGYKVEMSMK